MIRYGDLLAGYRKDVVRFVPCPENVGGLNTVCKIGDGWFFFGGQEAEVSTPVEYIASVGLRFAIERVYDALHDGNGLSGIESMDPDEYAYYEAVLEEAGCAGHIA